MLIDSKVFLLASATPSDIFLKDNNQLEYNKKRPLHGISDLGWKYQHLYFTLLEVKENRNASWLNDGDYVIWHENVLGKFKRVGDKNFDIICFDNNLSYCGTIPCTSECLGWVKKIIATTDERIAIQKDTLPYRTEWEKSQYGTEKRVLADVPKIFTFNFISLYNKGEIVTDVKVQFEQKEFQWVGEKNLAPYSLRVDSKDCIYYEMVITQKKAEKVWTTDEVINLVDDLFLKEYFDSYLNELIDSVVDKSQKEKSQENTPFSKSEVGKLWIQQILKK